MKLKNPRRSIIIFPRKNTSKWNVLQIKSNYDGVVYAMSGESLRHNRIERNVISEITNFLKNSECEILPGNMRVTTPSHDSYMYPDASIVCGEPILEDNKFDTLINPVVINEILSLSTRGIDKKRKFLFYREISSLKEYIMIDSLKRSFIVVRRQPDDSWKFQDFNEKDLELFIETIGYKLALSSIYKDTGL